MTQPRAIKTNGERQVCTSHLNLTVSIAEIDRREQHYEQVQKDLVLKRIKEMAEEIAS